LFLANEADMAEDYVAYDKWRKIVDCLKPQPNMPVTSSFYCKDLMDEIERYSHE